LHVFIFDETVMVTAMLWPDASTPLDGLKLTPPRTLVEANQVIWVWLAEPEITLAVQTKTPMFTEQSRCPTRLIDVGVTSRMADSPWGCCGAWVAVGTGVGVGVGVGVGLAVGDGTGVCFWVFAVVGPAVVEPQEASTAMARARQNTMTMLFVGLPLRGCKQRMADALDLGYHIEVLPNGKLLDRITIT
jgi:hypothetical protein